MKVESVDPISEYCQNVFLRSSNSNKLLVFLPSVNGKAFYPYYPRRSWGEELARNYNVLYVSDPYQPLPQYKEPMGSWFISPEGDSTIKTLSEKISQLKKEINVNDVIFYGSSMGGYAAIVLSSLISGSKAVAECPQIYLKKHPGSRFVCNNILKSCVAVEEIEPLSFLKFGKQKYVRILCSIFDQHYFQHIIPFTECLKNLNDGVNLNLTMSIYSNPNYKKGHVALQKNDALRVIQEVDGVDI